VKVISLVRKFCKDYTGDRKEYSNTGCQKCGNLDIYYDRVDTETHVWECMKGYAVDVLAFRRNESKGA